MDYEYALPPAAATLEALRGIGYSVSTAIADLVDNSVSADARNVWINFIWDGRQSFVTLLDDGRGMSETALSEAMRLGTHNPLETRAATDLGRFGLGLKTASFSQCRRLTVATRQRGSEIHFRQWDLDYVLQCNEWRVLKRVSTDSEARLSPLAEMTHGTLVLWENLDHLVGDVETSDEAEHARFIRTVDQVREHLGMVFHRFLEGRSPRLRIFVNGAGAEHQARPWDPYLEDHGSIPTPVEPLDVADGTIEVTGFVLPAKDRLSDEVHARAAGPRGWNWHQGFYVYRNQRLILPGSWLDLGWTKEEHYKLARLRLDIPNSMDGWWQIDVKKAVARPPAMVRRRLKELAENVRKQARDVYSHRASYQRSPSREPVVRAWKMVTKSDGITYQINCDHPFVKKCLEMGKVDRKELRELFRVLESTVPIQKIWIDKAEHPDEHLPPERAMDEKTALHAMRMLYVTFRKDRKITHQDAVGAVLAVEPFNFFPHLAESLIINSEDADD